VDTGPLPQGGDYRVMAANDLGMHCADLDYQIFSILPPFSVVHAQVLRRGTADANPEILTDEQAEMVYSAVSSPDDPAGAGSINTTSQNVGGGFKTNFWELIANKTLGGLAYGRLYDAGVFDSFEPLPPDLGIPVPDPVFLPALQAAQQAMPGTGNTPQRFDRFDTDLPFFATFPFGGVVQGVNWFAADGVPIMPVDDEGRSNAYPLMKIAARDNSSGDELASVDIVLPVASEADCQNCHADPNDFGNGAATQFAGVDFDVVTAAEAPGPEPLQNAAKINILRLHDAKHGDRYTSSADGSATPCDAANPDNCLANQTPVQCSQCHYSPALDLAQIGPVDDTQQGIKGRQQTRHISMSRAMHGHHGSLPEFMGEPLFPEMPPPDDVRRTAGTKINDFELDILDQTCYQCHPGKRTQCLRGAMFAGGVVCQDCHGNMTQVGDDFSGGFPENTGPDLSKRVPWASEPGCQSCHTGDARNPNHPDGAIKAADGIRLLQAYLPNDTSAKPITAAASRFAENESLYRLSKGHGGVMCEGCHGSTHAVWPNQNPFANDNVTAKQLQGHTGTITECVTCHAAGSLGNTLQGPHGMHPVGGGEFADGGHEDLEEDNPDSCRACHGNDGEGTVLSTVAVDRTFTIEECEEGSLCSNQEEENFTVTLNKGDQVSCTLCHENKL
jgi:hypothetical protein